MASLLASQSFHRLTKMQLYIVVAFKLAHYFVAYYAAVQECDASKDW